MKKAALLGRLDGRDLRPACELIPVSAGEQLNWRLHHRSS